MLSRVPWAPFACLSLYWSDAEYEASRLGAKVMSRRRAGSCCARCGLCFAVVQRGRDGRWGGVMVGKAAQEWPQPAGPHTCGTWQGVDGPLARRDCLHSWARVC